MQRAKGWSVSWGGGHDTHPPRSQSTFCPSGQATRRVALQAVTLLQSTFNAQQVART
jgi:hypothetical protein